MPADTTTPLAFLDLETTGLDPTTHEIIEAAVIRVDGHDLEILSVVRVRIQPHRLDLADPQSLEVNGFKEPWGGSELRPALELLTPLLDDANLAGHCVGAFDRPFLVEAYRKAGLPLPRFGRRMLDTQSLLWPLLQRGELKSLSLAACCDYYGISNDGAHGALVDARRSLEVARVRLLCQCQLDAGDSPCPIHGDTECPYCGESYVAKRGHDCAKAPAPKVEVVRFDKQAKGGEQ